MGKNMVGPKSAELEYSSMIRMIKGFKKPYDGFKFSNEEILFAFHFLYSKMDRLKDKIKELESK